MAPNWKNGEEPAIDQEELQAMSGSIELLGVANGGTGISTVPNNELLEGTGTGRLRTKKTYNAGSPVQVDLSSVNLNTVPLTRTLRWTINRTTSVAAADENLANVMARGIYAGTEDMTAGTTPLTSGVLYFVYE